MREAEAKELGLGGSFTQLSSETSSFLVKLFLTPIVPEEFFLFWVLVLFKLDLRRMSQSFFFKLLLYQDLANLTGTGSFLTLSSFVWLSLELGFTSGFLFREDGLKMDDLRLHGEPTLIFLFLVMVTVVRTVEEEESEAARPGMSEPGEDEDFCFCPVSVAVCLPLQNFPRQVWPQLQSGQKLEEENFGRVNKPAGFWWQYLFRRTTMVCPDIWS